MRENAKLTITPQFEDALPLHAGLAAVKQNGKWGFLKSNREFKVPPQFDQAWTLRGVAGVKRDGQWGYLQDNGKVIYGW